MKGSVNKRVDYVLQTLRSHNIGKNSYTVDRSLLRKESKYELRVEISAQFHDFTKCQEVSNFLVEKLDTSVEISRPSFHYMPGKLESLRLVLNSLHAIFVYVVMENSKKKKPISSGLSMINMQVIKESYFLHLEGSRVYLLCKMQELRHLK